LQVLDPPFLEVCYLSFRQPVFLFSFLFLLYHSLHPLPPPLISHSAPTPRRMRDRTEKERNIYIPTASRNPSQTRHPAARTPLWRLSRPSTHPQCCWRPDTQSSRRGPPSISVVQTAWALLYPYGPQSPAFLPRRKTQTSPFSLYYRRVWDEARSSRRFEKGFGELGRRRVLPVGGGIDSV
jgi:hypothetical protein